MNKHRYAVNSLCAALCVASLAPAVARADSRTRGGSPFLAAGKSHALLLMDGRGSVAWGSNGSGEIGNNSTAMAKAPVPLTAHDYRSVAAGAAFSIAIEYSGKMFGWGKTDVGQTGTKISTTIVKVPAQIGTANTWKAAAAGTNHACAIDAVGALYCWGDNGKGELGIGPSMSVYKPALVSAGPWLAVSAGNQFTVGLKADGTVWTWGNNASGQAGIGSMAATFSTPQTLGTSHRYVAIAAGGSHVLAIREDGTLWSWGGDAMGQLGINLTANKPSPVQITSPSAKWLAISAGNEDSFALRDNGVLYSFGSNASGQLGCGSCTSPQKQPVAVTGSDYQYVAAGYDFTVAITADGNLWTWGNNGSGQSANGTSGGTVTSPARVPGNGPGSSYAALKPAVLASGGGSLSDGLNGAHIKTSGVLETWGSYNAQPNPPVGGANTLGLGGLLASGVDQLTRARWDGYCDFNGVCWSPVPVLSARAFVGISAGYSAMLAIAADGQLWGWGENLVGEVGTGNKTTQPTPVKIGSSKWLKAYAGAYSSASWGIKSDGTLWKWGSAGGSSPAQACTSGACSGKKWASVAVGVGSTLGITTDGVLWVLGVATPYPLNGTAGNSPASWASLTWLDAQATSQDTSAIDSTGRLHTWGYGNYGQLGGGADDFGPVGGNTVPNDTIAVSNVLSASQCTISVLAVDVHGTPWAFGANYRGELGVGISGDGGYGEFPTNALTGDQLYGGPGGRYPTWASDGFYGNVHQAVCGTSSSFVEDSSGMVWTAGDNTYGAMGLGYAAAQSFADLQAQAGGAPLYPDSVYASAYDASLNPQNAGNVNLGGSGWSTGVNQANGQWFRMDLGTTGRYLSSIALDAASATTFPKSYYVSFSIDGTTWTSTPVSNGYGQRMTITFPLQWTRYVQITQTGTSPTPWTIASIQAQF